MGFEKYANLPALYSDIRRAVDHPRSERSDPLVKLPSKKTPRLTPMLAPTLPSVERRPRCSDSALADADSVSQQPGFCADRKVPDIAESSRCLRQVHVNSGRERAHDPGECPMSAMTGACLTRQLQPRVTLAEIRLEQVPHADAHARHAKLTIAPMSTSPCVSDDLVRSSARSSDRCRPPLESNGRSATERFQGRAGDEMAAHRLPETDPKLGQSQRASRNLGS
jgi:hypothetical protein